MDNPLFKLKILKTESHTKLIDMWVGWIEKKKRMAIVEEIIAVVNCFS